jgi:hypothetical protein
VPRRGLLCKEDSYSEEARWTRKREEIVAYLSNAEQRRRIIVLVRQKEGVHCPELIYTVEEGLGPAVVNYQCMESCPTKDLILTEEETRYIGLDRTAYGPPETGGY